MDDIWIISWFNHTAFDANPIWKSPITGRWGGGGTAWHIANLRPADDS